MFVAGAPTGLPLDQISQIVTAVAAALDHRHAHGLRHGDVRPSTIDIGPDGRAVLAEPGIGAVDVFYAAPEWLQGAPVDGRADQYSLACTVFGLLTGHVPFHGTDRAAVVAGQLGWPVPSVRLVHPFLPPQVDEVLGYATAKDPRFRYPSCGAFAAALAASFTAPPQPVHAPLRRHGWVAAASVVVAAAVTAAVVVANNGSGDDPAGRADATGTSGPAMTWDDTLYPQEAAAARRISGPDAFLRPLTGKPKPAWTVPMNGGQPDVVGGDDRIVTLRSGTYLIVLDAATGKLRWPVLDLRHDPMFCAVHENRIGCVAPAGAESDSSVFFVDADTGKLLKTATVPNRNLQYIAVAGDRFVASTRFGSGDDTGLAVGYTAEGEQVWTHEGNENLYVAPSEGLVVDGDPDSDHVSFVKTDDGKVLLRADRANSERDLQWNVYRGGIAVENKDGTGTDIYNLEGRKISSVAGWGPTGYQNVYAPSGTLPLLSRLGEKAPHYPDGRTVAAANPETGHLLWRVDVRGPSRQLVTLEDKLVVEIADPDAPTGPDGEPASTGKEFVRVYDVYTGKPLSPPVDMTRRVSVEIYWVQCDGQHLVYNYIEEDGTYVEVGYLISTGKKAWEVPMSGHPGYPGGAIVAPTGDDSVTLFK